MIEELIENAWEQNYGRSIPKQRFFTPKKKFWSELKDVMTKFDVGIFIDCGTGNGDIPNEALEQGIKMGGCDILHRKGNGPVDVQIIPAHRMPFNSTVWPLVCRPDHSGWVEHLWYRAIAAGAGFIYVGRPTAVENDVGEPPFEPVATIKDIGCEDECMVIWQSEDLKE